MITKQGIQRRRQGPTLQFKIQTLWQRKIAKQMGWTVRHTLSFTHGSGDNRGCERWPICGERTATKGILGARRRAPSLHRHIHHGGGTGTSSLTTLSKVSLYILSFRFYFRSFIFILDELQVKHRLIICWRAPRKKLGSSAVRPNTPRPAGLRLLVCNSVSIFGRYELRKF